MLRRKIDTRKGGTQLTGSPSTNPNNETNGRPNRSPVILLLVCMGLIYCVTNIHILSYAKNSQGKQILEDLTSPIDTDAIDTPIANDSSSDDPSIASETKAITDPVKSADSSNLRGVTSNANANINVISNSNTNITSEVQTYGRAAIVTKVLHVKDVQYLKEWVCLINHSYNDRMKHDFVIFTTMPWEESDIKELQKSAYPAKLIVALEAPSLEEQVAAMAAEEKNFLYKRCNVTEGKHISWFHYCTEPGSKHLNNLGYSWQAEFRAYHIWTHPALKDYKYMMWIDADASVGTHWDIDPIKAMEDNDLTVLYAGWPYGKIENNDNIKRKLINAYGTSICRVKKAAHPEGDAQIFAQTCNTTATIDPIAGNHHITNLDVFRKDVHQKFLKDFTGDHRFSRAADDQLAVTIVGLMEQYIQNNRTDVPKEFKVWHERSHGMKLMIAHHNMYDVVKAEKAPKNRKRFYNQVKGNWTGLEERCGAIMKG